MGPIRLKDLRHLDTLSHEDRHALEREHMVAEALKQHENDALARLAISGGNS